MVLSTSSVTLPLHTTKQFFEAAENAFSVGFNSVNADLIAGLPYEDYSSFENSFNHVV